MFGFFSVYSFISISYVQPKMQISVFTLFYIRTIKFLMSYVLFVPAQKPLLLGNKNASRQLRNSSARRRVYSAQYRTWVTWENARDLPLTRCPISATKRASISCRQRRPRPNVGPFYSRDYLRSYFPFKSILLTLLNLAI